MIELVSIIILILFIFLIIRNIKREKFNNIEKVLYCLYKKNELKSLNYLKIINKIKNDKDYKKKFIIQIVDIEENPDIIKILNTKNNSQLLLKIDKINYLINSEEYNVVKNTLIKILN